MDPPSYGRGPGGEVWKLENELYPLVEACEKVLAGDALFMLINSYTTGLQPAVLNNMLTMAVARHRGGKVTAEEIVLPVDRGRRTALRRDRALAGRVNILRGNA